MKKITIVLLLVLLSIASASSYFFYKQFIELEQIKNNRINFLENLDINENKNEYENIQSIEKKPKNINDIYISGWIPDWDYKNGINTLKKFNNTFDSVNPFWFNLKNDGSLEKLNGYSDQELIDFTQQNNIELIPTITSFDALTLSSVLNDGSTFVYHIDKIINEAKKEYISGIDIDYESIYAKDREEYLNFLRELQIELTKIDKKLVVTVHPKWGDDVIYLGLPETRYTQDYKVIGQIADEVRIMMYEYSGRNPKYYGPNSPIKWNEDIVRYAIYAGVPREKIVMAIPTYSYDYLNLEKLEEINYYPVLKSQFSESRGFAYYNNKIDEIIANNPEAKISYNEEWQEGILEYTFNRDGVIENRIIVYPTQESIDARKKLAAEFGIKGVSYWRIGDEGSLEY